MTSNTHQYMKPLILEDMFAINELAKATWAWEIKYWTEKRVDHGSFFLSIQNPKDNAWYKYQGTTIKEVIEKFLVAFTEDKAKNLEITDYP